MGIEESSKFQAPSPKEIPNFKFQFSRIGIWSFSGAWKLELGIFGRRKK
jgi:hypothetical protein